MKYLRKKGKWRTGESKYVIEENGKYIKTVPIAEELNDILKLPGRLVKQSDSIKENSKKPSEKFVYSPLTEVFNSGKIKTEEVNEPSEEDIGKTLKEIQTKEESEEKEELS